MLYFNQMREEPRVDSFFRKVYKMKYILISLIFVFLGVLFVRGCAIESEWEQDRVESYLYNAEKPGK